MNVRSENQGQNSGTAPQGSGPRATPASDLQEDLGAIVNAAAAFLRPRLEASPELRGLVHAVGRWLSAEASRAHTGPNVVPTAHTTTIEPQRIETRNSEPSVAVGAMPIAPPTASGASVEGASVARPIESRRSGYVPLKIGDLAVQIKVEGSTAELGRARSAVVHAAPEAPAHEAETRELDLALIVTRSRLKAEGCRTVIERRAEGANAIAMNERVADLLRRGKALPECFLWMFWRERPTPDDTVLERVATCYEAHGAAAEAVLHAVTLEEKYPKAYDSMVRAFQAFATANSALRVSMEDTWLTSPDRDQDEGHLWLRSEAYKRSVYVRRHMQLDDPASPDEIGAVRAEIDAVQRDLSKIEQSTKVVDSEIGKIKYHAKRLRDVGPEEWAEHTSKIAAALQRFVAAGHQRDDQRVLDMLGDEGARRVVESGAATGVLAVLAAAILRPVGEGDDAERDVPAGRAWSERVVEVRGLIAGTAMVVVGGERRRDAEDRLIDAFGLSSVEWVSLTEHASGAPLAAPIARADVSVVVVLIKLAGHHHVDEAVAYAAGAGKPLVRVKAGYNPEQVAEAVETQVGDRLRASARASHAG